MKVNEIIAYLNKLERIDFGFDELALIIMKKVQRNYQEKYTYLAQSPASKTMHAQLTALRQLQNPGTEVIRGTWHQFVDYLQDSNNVGKRLHTTFKLELENLILNNYISARYKTGHAHDATMHRAYAAATPFYSSIRAMSASSFWRSPTEWMGLAAISFISIPVLLGQGVINAGTRKPLGISKQKILIYQLMHITEVTRQQDIIKYVVDHYLPSFFNSNSSSRLYHMLISTHLTPERKMGRYLGLYNAKGWRLSN